MSWRQSLILWSAYALFLVVGAAMFSYMECEPHRWQEIEEPDEWKTIKGVAMGEEGRPAEDEVLELSRWLPLVCPDLANATINAITSASTMGAKQQQQQQPGIHGAVLEAEQQCGALRQEVQKEDWDCHWSFLDGLFFCMTVTTTIGYGMQYPLTGLGRVVYMLYAMVGIPLLGLMLASTSGFFGDQLFKLFKAKLDSEQQEDKRFIALFTLVYIVAGCVVFTLIPAAVFVAVEDWSYLSSVYFCLTTLTTIGFGDLVPIGGYGGREQMGGVLFAVYQIGVILWIIVGLGYWVVVANFTHKALKSKRLQ